MFKFLPLIFFISCASSSPHWVYKKSSQKLSSGKTVTKICRTRIDKSLPTECKNEYDSGFDDFMDEYNWAKEKTKDLDYAQRSSGLIYRTYTITRKNSSGTFKKLKICRFKVGKEDEKYCKTQGEDGFSELLSELKKRKN